MLLEVKDLAVQYSQRGVVPALRGVSFGVEENQTLGIVGESGCGKSTAALSILSLIAPHEGRITRGEILFQGKNILSLDPRALREIRGKDIGIVFQDPFTSLNPVLTIADQIAECILVHDPSAAKSALERRVTDLLRQVRIDDPERIARSYPHQISGGQRQRALIAMAIANRPKLLIADEPTTALDVTVQKEILELLAQLKNELRISVILITHHLGIVAHYTDRLAVLYAGEIVEYGATADLIRNPQHPYTRALIAAVPEHTHRAGSEKREKFYTIAGAPPDLRKIPSGCPFHPRCPYKVDRCDSEVPLLRRVPGTNQVAACHLAPIKDGKEL